MYTYTKTMHFACAGTRRPRGPRPRQCGWPPLSAPRSSRPQTYAGPALLCVFHVCTVSKKGFHFLTPVHSSFYIPLSTFAHSSFHIRTFLIPHSYVRFLSCQQGARSISSSSLVSAPAAHGSETAQTCSSLTLSHRGSSAGISGLAFETALSHSPCTAGGKVKRALTGPETKPSRDSPRPVPRRTWARPAISNGSAREVDPLGRGGREQGCFQDEHFH